MLIYGVIGIVHLGLNSFLVVISKADTVVQMMDVEVMKITEVQTIPFSLGSLPDDIGRYLMSLSKVGDIQFLTNGFYFSYHYDLTNSLERNKKVRRDGTLHELADLRFYWNHDMYKDFTSQSIEPRFYLPIVQGFVAVAPPSDQAVTLLLISRRSCHRAGTRYNARGVDEEGHVGNFVETEQVVYIGDTVYSFLQTRGSAPVFWTQSGLAAQVALSKSKEVTNDAFLKHIQSSVDTYGHITIVNLLDIDKPHERMLTESMETLLNQHRADMENHVGYLYFNFNKVCKGDRYHELRHMLDHLSPLLDYYHYFSIQHEEVVTVQRGVTRINCLDSLDRTNVVMSRIAWRVLCKQVEASGGVLDADYDTANPQNDLLRAFKNAWADTGDMLSHQYTGTRSTISSVTRHGKQGLKGLVEQGINSLRRFYEANVEDGMKQEVIELMLGRHHLTKGRSLTALLDRATRMKQAAYTRYYAATMRAACWNVSGLRPENLTDEDFCAWLFEEDSPQTPHIFLIALQDLSPRKCKSQALNSPAELVQSWNDTLLSQLSRCGNYALARAEEMSGTYLAVFVLESIAGAVTSVEVDQVKVTEEGRGAVLIRFNMWSSSFCICNASLQRCSEQVSQRLSQLIDIEKLAFQQSGARAKLQIDQHDVKILLGDLNFRIEMSQSAVMHSTQTMDVRTLLENDQLVLAQKHAHSVLSKFSEPDFGFLPTYKYSRESDEYENVTPAWCSRILFAGDKISPSDYRRCEVKGSKQRPIRCTFDIAIKEIDEEAMRRSELTS